MDSEAGSDTSDLYERATQRWARDATPSLAEESEESSDSDTSGPATFEGTAGRDNQYVTPVSYDSLWSAGAVVLLSLDVDDPYATESAAEAGNAVAVLQRSAACPSAFRARLASPPTALGLRLSVVPSTFVTRLLRIVTCSSDFVLVASAERALRHVATVCTPAAGVVPLRIHLDELLSWFRALGPDPDALSRAARRSPEEEAPGQSGAPPLPFAAPAVSSHATRIEAGSVPAVNLAPLCRLAAHWALSQSWPLHERTVVLRVLFLVLASTRTRAQAQVAEAFLALLHGMLPTSGPDPGARLAWALVSHDLGLEAAASEGAAPWASERAVLDAAAAAQALASVRARSWVSQRFVSQAALLCLRARVLPQLLRVLGAHLPPPPQAAPSDAHLCSMAAPLAADEVLPVVRLATHSTCDGVGRARVEHAAWPAATAVLQACQRQLWRSAAPGPPPDWARPCRRCNGNAALAPARAVFQLLSLAVQDPRLWGGAPGGAGRVAGIHSRGARVPAPVAALRLALDDTRPSALKAEPTAEAARRRVLRSALLHACKLIEASAPLAPAPRGPTQQTLLSLRRRRPRPDEADGTGSDGSPCSETDG